MCAGSYGRIPGFFISERTVVVSGLVCVVMVDLG